MRTHLVVTAIIGLSSIMLGQSPFIGRYVDLSHAYDSSSVFWPTEKGFVLERGPAGVTPGGYFYSANRFWTPEHGGPHIDAPSPFAERGWQAHEIPLDRLIGPAIVIDISAKCARDRDYLVTASDIVEWEAIHGQIRADMIVLFRTGYSAHWPDRVKYMGTDERGQQAVAKLHFPGLDPAAAAWLVAKRKVKSVGIDTPSIDYGQSTTFGTHVALFAHNVPAFENLTSLEQLPPKDFLIIALPMKIWGGSGGPLRIIAVLGS